jgi:hypothetical protein
MDRTYPLLGREKAGKGGDCVRAGKITSFSFLEGNRKYGQKSNSNYNMGLGFGSHAIVKSYPVKQAPEELSQWHLKVGLAQGAGQ